MAGPYLELVLPTDREGPDTGLGVSALSELSQSACSPDLVLGRVSGSASWEPSNGDPLQWSDGAFVGKSLMILGP